MGKNLNFLDMKFKVMI